MIKRLIFNRIDLSIVIAALLLATGCGSKTYLADTFEKEVTDKYKVEILWEKVSENDQQTLEISLIKAQLDSVEVEAASSIIAMMAFRNLTEKGKATYDQIKVNTSKVRLENQNYSYVYPIHDLKKVADNWAQLEEYFSNEKDEPMENLYQYFDSDIFPQEQLGSFIQGFRDLDAKEKFKSNTLIGFQIGTLNNDQRAILYLVQKDFEKATIQLVYIFKYDSNDNLIAGVSTM